MLSVVVRFVEKRPAPTKHEIFAKSEGEFFYRVVDARISFVRADDGAVEKLILHQSGQHIDGYRE